MPIAIDVAPERGQLPETLVFGATYTDHMFSQRYRQEAGWHDARIGPLQPLALHPAAAVLHYSQEIFEGLKAYRRADGGINLFRPDQNVARFNRSARRMVMPEVDAALHLAALKQFVDLERHWVPAAPGASLYLRPTMIATAPRLDLSAATEFLHFIIASPVGGYFGAGFQSVDVLVSDQCRRAVVGGVGEAKTGGNYAASLYASDAAARQGYQQVLWLDAREGRFIEEVGSMNICFVYADGSIRTPALTGSILPGITRDSLMQLAPRLGHSLEEAQLDIDEVLAGIDAGEITEVFGCGTSAVISPIGRLAFRGSEHVIGGGQPGPVARRLYETLSGIQYGSVEDPFGWVVRLD
ncbi:branched-chain amino acid aminotransferase [Parahaliea aestuarii]